MAAQFKGSATALVTPFKDGAVDEHAFRALVDWQIGEGVARARPLRHHGREPHPDARRAHARGRSLHSRGAKPRSRHRGRRLQQYGGSRGSGPPCRTGGCRCGPGRDTVLQQTQPGRPLPPFQGGERRHRHPDHHLQYSPALGDRHVGRDDAASLRTPQYHRG